MISIEDVFGLVDQPNLPGTTIEHPNWRRRLPVDLEEIPNLNPLELVTQILKMGRRAANSFQDQ
jgi:4-alpha-glucanotransferase